MRVDLVPGFLQITDDNNRKSQIAIADVLRAADIPALTYEQVQSIKTLSNLTVVLIRTLIDRQVLGESFLEDDDYDLDALIETIEAMGGSYDEPDLAVD
jgi:hypothetical protein